MLDATEHLAAELHETKRRLARAYHVDPDAPWRLMSEEYRALMIATIKLMQVNGSIANGWTT